MRMFKHSSPSRGSAAALGTLTDAFPARAGLSRRRPGRAQGGWWWQWVLAALLWWLGG
jgi:hypothetical protein